MTDEMRQNQFDREIRSFLAAQADDIGGAPSAIDMTARLVASSTKVGRIGLGSTTQFAWIALAGLLIAGLLGAMAVGARLLRNDAVVVNVVPTEPAPIAFDAYEAVFVRFAEATGMSEDIVVVGVDAQGNEREIAYLPNDQLSGVDVRAQILIEGAALSTTGLLALPRSIGDYRYHWEIFDLRQLAAEPLVIDGIVQHFEKRRPYFDGDQRPSAFWGPDDQVAILWYPSDSVDWHVSFVDGRSGLIETVDVPEFPDHSVYPVPYWAADGSGILVAIHKQFETHAPTLSSPQQLLRDGSVVEPTGDLVSDGHSRRFNTDGFEATRLYVTPPGSTRPSESPVGPLGDLVAKKTSHISDVAWTADGEGTWLVVSSVGEAQVVTIHGDSSTSAVETIATILEVDREAHRVDARFLGLAPDDSMVVVSMERSVTTAISGGQNTAIFPDFTPSLIVRENGARFEIEGSFAGWLGVTP